MQITKKYFQKYKDPILVYPDLVESQNNSFDWFLDIGIREVLKEFSMIEDYAKKKFELSFLDFELTRPKYDEHYAKSNKLTYEGQIKAKVRLKNKIQNSVKEQEMFLADLPLMTDHGTFIINGIERVIVPQLARSFGMFFTTNEIKGKRYFGAKIIPARGVWIEIESDADDLIYVKIDKKRKFFITSLLRVLGATDKQMVEQFKDNEEVQKAMELNLAKDHAKTVEDSYIEIYKRLRDGDLATAENAKEFISGIFNTDRYDISKVGRFRFNKRFSKVLEGKELERKTINLDDLFTIIAKIVSLNHDEDAVEDDIDHLGSRRVRFVGELFQAKVRIGMSQMKRNIQDRMSTVDPDITMPVNFISPRPLQARIKEFFTTNQLSQFMAQENILQEIEHLRTLSALGPGGLTRERAGFEVRDVHPSHYGRVCPIHTPEGPNIGLILRLSTHARINDFGMVETPYAKVENGKITKEVKYLNALEEENFKIAHAATAYDKDLNILTDEVEVRINGIPTIVKKNEVDLIDVNTAQAFSIATTMIPFLDHDDANRALMGSNMQKQATPCLIPEAPLVATGIEEKAARDSGRLIYAEEDGVVSYADAREVRIKNAKGKEKSYKLAIFNRTNGFTAF